MRARARTAADKDMVVLLAAYRDRVRAISQRLKAAAEESNRLKAEAALERTIAAAALEQARLISRQASERPTKPIE